MPMIAVQALSELTPDYLLQVADEIVNTQLDEDFARVWQIVTFFESSQCRAGYAIAFQQKLVRLLLRKYVESDFAYPSYLWIVSKAHPIAFVRPIWHLVKYHSDKILPKLPPILYGDALGLDQMLIVIDNFHFGYPENAKAKRILQRKYILDYLQICSESHHESNSELSTRILDHILDR